MARVGLLNGRGRDLPIQVNESFGAVAAGTGADFEYVVDTITDISKTYTAGTKALTPSNYCKLRTALIIPNAAIVGNDTNNCTFNINQWRAGSFLKTLATYALTATPANSLAAKTPLELIPTGDTLNPGDVITIARVSNNATGLATPIFMVKLDYSRV